MDIRTTKQSVTVKLVCVQMDIDKTILPASARNAPQDRCTTRQQVNARPSFAQEGTTATRQRSARNARRVLTLTPAARVVANASMIRTTAHYWEAVSDALMEASSTQCLLNASNAQMGLDMLTKLENAFR